MIFAIFLFFRIQAVVVIRNPAEVRRDEMIDGQCRLTDFQFIGLTTQGIVGIRLAVSIVRSNIFALHKRMRPSLHFLISVRSVFQRLIRRQHVHYYKNTEPH